MKKSTFFSILTTVTAVLISSNTVYAHSDSNSQDCHLRFERFDENVTFPFAKTGSLISPFAKLNTLPSLSITRCSTWNNTLPNDKAYFAEYVIDLVTIRGVNAEHCYAEKVINQLDQLC